MKFARLTFLSLLLIFSPLAFAAKNNPPAPTPPSTNEADPFENYNRHAYHLNDTFDRVILKPIASMYKTALPWPIARGVSNFFGNLRDLTSIPNHLLQAKFFEAYRDTWRILVNTTVGVGGLVDVSSKIGLEKHPADLGLTFARWGYKKSAFFIIPFLGPSTVRDTVALPIDWTFFTVYTYIPNVSFRNELWATEQVSNRADLLKYEKVLHEASYDPYVFQRDAYLQHRDYLISGSKEGAGEEGVDVYEEDTSAAKPSEKIAANKTTKATLTKTVSTLPQTKNARATPDTSVAQSASR